ncbi:MAG: hypothetical protein JWP85_2340 [Rhodoglobus sp.]|nr:hypothetical protein [Rhodoglobus sp.]
MIEWFPHGHGCREGGVRAREKHGMFRGGPTVTLRLGRGTGRELPLHSEVEASRGIRSMSSDAADAHKLIESAFAVLAIVFAASFGSSESCLP